jgi:hypothetical protein
MMRRLSAAFTCTYNSKPVTLTITSSSRWVYVVTGYVLRRGETFFLKSDLYVRFFVLDTLKLTSFTLISMDLHAPLLDNGKIIIIYFCQHKVNLRLANYSTVNESWPLPLWR